MAIKTIDSIDEKIKKLQEKKKRAITKRNNEIGKYLTEKWNTDNIEIIKLVIDSLTDQAENLILNLENSNINNEEYSNNGVEVTNENKQ